MSKRTPGDRGRGDRDPEEVDPRRIDFEAHFGGRDVPGSAEPSADAVAALAARYRAGEPVKAIVAYEMPDGRRGVLSGRLRVLAARRAGLTTVPAYVITTPLSERRKWELAMGLRKLEEQRGCGDG